VSWFWWRSAGTAAGTPTRVVVTLSPDVSLNLAVHRILAMSRDGSKIALVADHKGIDQLYLRPMDEFEPRLIEGTDDASSRCRRSRPVTSGPSSFHWAQLSRAK
jgi:hypothetical protein